MIYFAYGSNMSARRMLARIRSASLLAPARLAGHRLRFHKIGLDNSGKCDAWASGQAEDEVLGVLYRMDPSERGLLDEIEGPGYEVVHHPVQTATGPVDAFLYVANRIDQDILPYDWYHAHVLYGATEQQLPPGYIERHIATVACRPDPDQKRARRERAIYEASAIF